MHVTNELLEGKTIQVQIAMGERSGRAFITKNWGKVARDTQLLAREMAIFWFKEHVHDGLRLNIFTGIPIGVSFWGHVDEMYDWTCIMLWWSEYLLSTNIAMYGTYQLLILFVLRTGSS